MSSDEPSKTCKIVWTIRTGIKASQEKGAVPYQVAAYKETLNFG